MEGVSPRKKTWGVRCRKRLAGSLCKADSMDCRKCRKLKMYLMAKAGCEPVNDFLVLAHPSHL